VQSLCSSAAHERPYRRVEGGHEEDQAEGRQAEEQAPERALRAQDPSAGGGQGRGIRAGGGQQLQPDVEVGQEQAEQEDLADGARPLGRRAGLAVSVCREEGGVGGCVLWGGGDLEQGLCGRVALQRCDQVSPREGLQSGVAGEEGGAGAGGGLAPDAAGAGPEELEQHPARDGRRHAKHQQEEHAENVRGVIAALLRSGKGQVKVRPS
jgi:hypothetical protein